jgi:hypothetical protein
MLFTGDYVIINKQTNEALDSNINSGSQLSQQHPRPFMWQANSNAPNHQWRVEKQFNGNYIIKTRVNSQEMALDGNTNVPQHRSSHPCPFLYPVTPNAKNHRWILRPTGEYNTYMIVNEDNGLALDGNVTSADQYDYSHKAPFLWTPVPTAQNHLWSFQQVNYYYHQDNQHNNNNNNNHNGYQNMDGPAVQVDCCTIL